MTTKPSPRAVGSTSVADGPGSSARNIGRIGALAVALGVGAAVATGHGVAVAHAETESGSSDSSSSSPAEASPSDSSSGTASSAPSAASDDVASATAPDPSSPNESSPGTRDPGDSVVPEMNFGNTGGAHTSTLDDPPTVESDAADPTQPAGTTEPPTTPIVDPPNPETKGSEAQSDSTTRHPKASAPAVRPRAAESTSATAEPASALEELAGSEPDDQQNLATTSGTAAAITPDPTTAQGDAPAEPASAPNVAAAMLAAVVSPFALPDPAVPTQSPLLWTILAWTRRESQGDVVTLTPSAEAGVPLAVDDVAFTPPDTAVSIRVLDNDFGTQLTVKLGSQPRAGTVKIDKEGTLVYTPKAGFQGVDTFTYAVTDGAGNTSTATITVTVRKNGPPTAKDDVVQTRINTPVVIDVLANDADPDGDRLLVGIDSAPGYGKVSVGKDGSLVYTPLPGFTGKDVLKYTITDGSGEISYASVTITVTGKDDGKWYTVGQDSTLTVPVLQGVLAGQTEFGGWSVAMSEKPSHGTVDVKEDGSFAYTPEPGFVGLDTFTVYAFSKEGGKVPVTVTIEVTPTGVQALAGDGVGSSAQACQGNWLAKLYVPDGDEWWCSFPEARRPSDRL